MVAGFACCISGFLPPFPEEEGYPPYPLPRREGGDQSYFMQGASPLASPGLGGARHWERGRTTRPAGACPLQGGVRGASRCPAAGVPGWLPAKPPFSLLFCAHPPNPLPGGKGEILGYFMQGASPLASPGRNPRGTGEGGEPRARRGACPVGCPLTLPLACFSAPIPPSPFPAGRGSQSYFMQGAEPLASPGLNLYGAGSTFGKQFLWVMPKTFPFNSIIEKSSGGSGGLFQESPSVF